jgi:hypothetical protein
MFHSKDQTNKFNCKPHYEYTIAKLVSSSFRYKKKHFSLHFTLLCLFVSFSPEKKKHTHLFSMACPVGPGCITWALTAKKNCIFYCYVSTCCQGNVFTTLRPTNGHIYLLHYTNFQPPSHHIMYVNNFQKPSTKFPFIYTDAV